MIKGLIRTGFTVGFVYGVYSLARLFWAEEIDDAVGSAIDTAKSRGKELLNRGKEAGQDVLNRSPELKASVNEISRKAM
jgi:hypothetical protein